MHVNKYVMSEYINNNGNNKYVLSTGVMALIIFKTKLRNVHLPPPPTPPPTPISHKVKEGNALFNDAFNTLYLRFYEVGLITREETVAPLNEIFYMHHNIERE